MFNFNVWISHGLWNFFLRLWYFPRNENATGEKKVENWSSNIGISSSRREKMCYIVRILCRCVCVCYEICTFHRNGLYKAFKLFITFTEDGGTTTSKQITFNSLRVILRAKWLFYFALLSIKSESLRSSDDYNHFKHTFSVSSSSFVYLTRIFTLQKHSKNSWANNKETVANGNVWFVLGFILNHCLYILATVTSLYSPTLTLLRCIQNTRIDRRYQIFNILKYR